MLDIAAPGDGSEDSAALLTDGIAEEDQRYASDEAGWYQAKQIREKAFPLNIMKAGFHLSVQTAQASLDIDRKRILNSLAGITIFQREPPVSHDRYEYINNKLRAHLAMATWQQAVDQREPFADDLPAILSCDDTREALCMNFAFSAIDNEDIDAIAMALPIDLVELRLYFRACEGVTDDALDRLAAGIDRLAKLETLELFVKNCDKFTDQGLAVLSAALPPSIKILRMNCHGSRISDPGVSTLMLNLNRLLDLKELVVDLSATSVSLKGLGAMPLALPDGVEKVAVHLRNTKVSNEDRSMFSDVHKLKHWLPHLDEVQPPLEVHGRWENRRPGHRPTE